MSKRMVILQDSAPQLAAALREQLRRFEASRPLQDACPISSGCRELDHILPAGGFPRGTLVECLGHGPNAGGAGTCAMIWARQASLEGGAIVVLDHQQWFYPPAAAVLGVDLEAVIVVRTGQQRDQLWAVDQALRCPAVAAVWAPLQQLDEHDFRRLQLAAEAGGGLGLLIRSHKVLKQPSWSDMQLLIHPRAGPAPQANHAQKLQTGRRLRIEVVRCRQGQSGGVVDVEIDVVTGAMQPVSSEHETRTVYPAAKLAYPASGSRSARA